MCGESLHVGNNNVSFFFAFAVAAAFLIASNGREGGSQERPWI